MSRNDITGDKLISKPTGSAFASGYEAINWGIPKKEETKSEDIRITKPHYLLKEDNKKDVQK